MEINKEELLNLNGSNSFAHHVFIEALSNTLKKKEFEEVLEKVKGKKTVEVSLIIEGIEFPFLHLCDIWENEVERMLDARAETLVNNKCVYLCNIVDDICTNIKEKACKKLGIDIEKE